MKKAWETRLTALFCACALLLSGALFPAGAVETDFIFLALNDQMVYPLSTATMPISISGTIYVPYYIFDYNYMSKLGVDADLGIRVASDSNTVTLYNKRRSLIYDLNAGTCVDSKTGVSYPRAIVRGGVTYLQANSVCNFFMEDGLDYFYIGTEYGPIIRIVTPSVILDKDRFQDAATLGIPDAIRDYNKSQNPNPSVSPSPSSSASPSPSPSIEPESPDKSGVSVFFSFQCSGGEDFVALLDVLEREQLPALLFFRPEDLAGNEALVRRAVGAGHAVGLTVGGGPTGDAASALAEGNRLLGLIAHTATRIVTMETPDSASAQALEAEGWSVWNANISAASGGSGASYSAALLKNIDAKRALARVTMDDSARSAAALPLLLRELRAQRYTIRLAVGSNIM